MDGKESAKKFLSIRTLKGKESVEKGAKFEDKIASMYKLLGAEVVQNVMINNKKVDILATFRIPTKHKGHRIIVECKNVKKNMSQTVMEFEGILKNARTLDVADAAEIITSTPWSDQAKGFALESSVELFTYEQKISSLIDFKSYLKKIIDSFENGYSKLQSDPPLKAYYVDPIAEHTTNKGNVQKIIVEDYINKWVQQKNTCSQMAVLGEFGTGKTSFCLKLAHDFANQYLKSPISNRIPILFNLRDFTKTLKIEPLISSFLDIECEATNPKFSLFRSMNEAGFFLIIFDGFDEMAEKVDADILEKNLLEIEKLATPQKSKIIITSRIEHFVSLEEEKKSFKPKCEALPIREIEYEALKIIPWNEEQINCFLQKRVSLIKDKKHSWSYYRDRINEFQGLSELSSRPVLLDMIVKTLPQLIESGVKINRSNLYKTYLNAEIRRQKIIKGRTLLLSNEDRFSLLKNIAMDIYDGRISVITQLDALKYIEKYLKVSKNELEFYSRDFLTCSFLIRKGDEYHFAHKSIMEYLTAKSLIEKINENSFEIFDRKLIDPVVNGFLVELRPDTNTLLSWLESTQTEDMKKSKYLGGNAATILCKYNRGVLSGKDLSRAILLGADLSFAYLVGTNFSHAYFQNINLANAQFREVDIISSQFIDVTVSFWFVGKSNEIEKKEDFHFLIKETLQIIESINRRYSWEIHKLDVDSFVGKINISIPKFEHIRIIQNEFTIRPDIEFVAVYAEEWQKLIQKIPENKRYVLNQFQI